MSNLKNPIFWAHGVFFAYGAFLFLFLSFIVPTTIIGKVILFVLVIWPVIAFVRSIWRPIPMEASYRNSIIAANIFMVIVGTISSSFLLVNLERWHQVSSWNHGFLVFCASSLPFGLMSLIICMLANFLDNSVPI